MPPTPYVLPTGYEVLTGNHGAPILDASNQTFWGLNVKKGGPLYFAVFLQPATGQAREVLAFKNPSGDVGQGKIGLQAGDQELWASAFRTPDDALSSPFVGQVKEFMPFSAKDTQARKYTDEARGDIKAITEAVAKFAEEMPKLDY